MVGLGAEVLKDEVEEQGCHVNGHDFERCPSDGRIYSHLEETPFDVYRRSGPRARLKDT